YPMFMNVPGLKVIAPASASDAKGLLRTAIDSNDPVLTFEAVPIWGLKEEVDDNEYWIPFGVARTRREGTDCTLVGISGSLRLALKAAEQLEDQYSVEVIDPRTLVPLDSKTIIESVKKTGRLVIAEPAHRTCGAAAEIAAIVAEAAQPYLKAPIIRVTAVNMQIPFSPALEKFMYPTTEKIAAAIKTACSA
ncbi:MAG: alpha-ketoacid dehydrogenase subunit beta, partial [Proteobacteria bacterium]|nr:alpha-ketoacid dehydrogenase subunit beta [Pseudomonadota bacterium]